MVVSGWTSWTLQLIALNKVQYIPGDDYMRETGSLPDGFKNQTVPSRGSVK